MTGLVVCSTAWVGFSGCVRTPDVCGEASLSGSSTVAVAVTDRRFTAGVLCSLGGQVDEVSLASGDPLIRADEERWFLVNRAGGDAISAYEIGRNDAPVWEMSLPVGSNVHDAIVVDNRLFLPAYGTGVIHVVDADSGVMVDEVDLGELDADAAPDRVVLLGDELWVADQQRPLTSTVGRLWPMDVTDLSVGSPLDTFPNPRISPSEDGLWVASGRFAFAAATLDTDVRDGRLQRFVPGAGLDEAVLFESVEVADIHHAVQVGTTVVVGLVEPDGRSRIRCGTNGVFADGPTSDGWLVSMVADERDVVVGIRTTFIQDELDLADRGIRRLDPVTCDWAGPLLPTVLEPYDLAVVPPM